MARFSGTGLACSLTSLRAIDTQGSLLYDLPSLAISGARNFPPPASEGLWGAKTVKEWNMERLKEGKDGYAGVLPSRALIRDNDRPGYKRADPK